MTRDIHDRTRDISNFMIRGGWAELAHPPRIIKLPQFDFKWHSPYLYCGFQTLSQQRNDSSNFPQSSNPSHVKHDCYPQLGASKQTNNGTIQIHSM